LADTVEVAAVEQAVHITVVAQRLEEMEVGLWEAAVAAQVRQVLVGHLVVLVVLEVLTDSGGAEMVEMVEMDVEAMALLAQVEQELLELLVVLARHMINSLLLCHLRSTKLQLERAREQHPAQSLTNYGTH